MLQQINQNLKQLVPYYDQASQLTTKTYQNGLQSVNQLTNKFEQRVSQSKQEVLKIKRGLQNQILSLVEQASNELLVRTEKLLLTQQERPSESQKKQIQKRFRRIFNKILNDYIIYYAQQAKQYNMALIRQGRQYVYTYVYPLYIKVKAAIIVSKEILMEMLESRLDNMKMTYTVSKDTVTMLIGGKFQEDKIIQKINSGMENFKQLTVKVVKKGLQIKVDKKSLYQNYQTFCLKMMEVIHQMRSKGAQKIVSAKQKTTMLYQSVLNRIREKQIQLKMQYKQLTDKVQQAKNQELQSL